MAWLLLLPAVLCFLGTSVASAGGPTRIHLPVSMGKTPLAPEPPPPAPPTDPEVTTLINLMNGARQQVGCAPLAVSPKLTDAATQHSAEMARLNFFSHNSANGGSFDQRIRATGYTYNTWLAENIAAGQKTGQAAYDAWYNSPGHRANMLSCNFHAVGIGHITNPASTYKVYWTADFGGVAEG